MFEAPNEPQDFGKTLDTGFRLFGAGWKRGMLIILYMILVLGVLAGILTAAFVPLLDDPSGPPGFLIGLALVIAPLFLFAWTIFMNALTAFFGALYRGVDLHIGDALRVDLNKMFPVIGWYLLFLLMVFGAMLPGGIIIGIGIASQEPAIIAMTMFFGFFVFAVPYFFVIVLFVFGPYLIVIENMGVMEAFAEAKRLVWGNWWRTFAYGIVVTLLVWIISMVISLPLGVVGFMMELNGEVGGSLVLQVINNLLSLLVYPLSVAMTLSYMFDMMLRRSGSDLAARLA